MVPCLNSSQFTLQHYVVYLRSVWKGEKILWENEKMLVTSIVSFSHNVFNSFLFHVIKNVNDKILLTFLCQLQWKHMPLTHSHTMTRFDGRGKKPFENIVGKREIACTSNFFFSTMFSTLSKTEMIIFVRFNLSSTNAFNLVWFKILFCGNGLKMKGTKLSSVVYFLQFTKNCFPSKNLC